MLIDLIVKLSLSHQAGPVTSEEQLSKKASRRSTRFIAFTYHLAE